MNKKCFDINIKLTNIVSGEVGMVKLILGYCDI